MRYLIRILLAFLLLTFTVSAKDVTFEWDASPDTDIIQYKLYFFLGELQVKVTDIPVSTPVATYSCTVAIEPGEAKSVYVTAVNAAGLESLPSNTLILPGLATSPQNVVPTVIP